MSKTYNNRYLKDSDGDIYLPMTSTECIIDIDKINNANNIVEINTKINDLEELVKSQGKEIETLKAKVNQRESEGTK
ncbi:hypothetical protein BJG88_10205 [Staphylococcus nepalensis]|uniref:hypothetical protein n=1 Tax=Staphylococcus nepalensis TaxID=214473 RepID=UPI000D58B187|nr:hypothetical protein [Staphylococcus nepalensis]AWI44797.1 hypothetical protein BJG88_08615 [Staphylococcus nepalensis]AWI45085.1 hypothetical protein BJG88_10205 [Staphylococcus nepalensis]